MNTRGPQGLRPVGSSVFQARFVERECWCVARLPCSDVEGKRPCAAVADEVNLRAQAASGASETVIVGLSPARCPFFLAPAACW